MKRSTIGVALVSFVLGALLARTATDGFARSTEASKPSLYTDARYGYSIAPPAFPKGAKDTAGLAATFFAPARNGFAPNLGLMIQNVAMTADDYRDLSRKQFKQADFTVLSETAKKVGGKDAILWEYEGKSGGRELRWIGLAVVDTDKIYLLTATAPKADFDALAPEFRAAIDSFTLGD
ncbi:MAG: hypothetical protein JO332_13225 [Planctomycetaceae bacterium]|nr:hypothetical protein [Planctomycetaceae bacterium]